ncbi:MAG: NAD(P)/FAD-dependent oxidoreductase [Desulfovibrionaceae bacterium]|nr:NAD(P)/FAD-dependent oxidoreductase [Desulfovibrionaceae bacterium]
MTAKTAVIIGGGPAGLTAALELLRQTEVRPVVLEAEDQVGGISKTRVYRGNRIDFGGHRFFSKHERIMRWWREVLPLQGAPARDDVLLGRDLSGLLDPAGPDPETSDPVMLVRFRLSRILFLRRFFDYPVSLSLRTLKNLGPLRVARIGLSYLRARLARAREPANLEEFFIARFGRELYRLFFRDYTEKVWGAPCRELPADWGAQRVKGLSVARVLGHAAKALVSRDSSLEQKKTETSLIGRFLYPKYGPGQMWEAVAGMVGRRGGEIRLGARVTGLDVRDGRVVRVRFRDPGGDEQAIEPEWVFSSMPVKDLVAAMAGAAPEDVTRAAQGLVYRDFVTVGLLLGKLALKDDSRGPDGLVPDGLVPDNWIYVQEPDVRLGRLQVFNNWSPYLVADPDLVWLGAEYFCTQGDDFWGLSDQAIRDLAVDELARIGVIDRADVLDGVALRMPKAYPAYLGTYADFDLVRGFLDGLENLFCIGRNGQHRYNNMDHSMLTAMYAVEAVRDGLADKSRVWSVNTGDRYHEDPGDRGGK